jgi:heat shock protein HtpX
MALAYSLFSYFSAAKIALFTNRAKKVTEADYPELFKMVGEICESTKLPMPNIYIINDSAINAFATGRNPKNSHVAVTLGAIELLDSHELKAVLAHEMGHIKNYDIRMMMAVFACITFVNILLDFIARSFLFGGSSDDDGPGSGFGIILYILSIFLVPLVGMLVSAAISRQRELLADHTSADITHKPEDLITALKKIEAHGSKLKLSSTATAHLFFANPLKPKSLASLFSTHPPIEERILQLKKLKD